MFTKEFVLEKLSHIKDETTGEPIIIEATSGSEEKKHVNVRVAISQDLQRKKEEIEARIIHALKLEGAKTVGVLFDEKEKAVENKEETILTTKNPPIFIAIASGKGGVGKSTVTVNLAVALARLGKKAGIVDSDIYGPSIPRMMGVTERPFVENDKVLPIESHGVKIISMDFFKNEDEPVVWRGPMLGRMIDIFLNQVRWGEIDYLLFDLPPGTGDIAMDISSRVPGCKEIIVTTPHPTAAFVAKHAGKMALNTTKHQVLGVIENMSYIDMSDGQRQHIFGKGGGEKLAGELGTELLAQIPMSMPVEENGNITSVYGELHPTSEIYKELATRIISL